MNMVCGMRKTSFFMIPSLFPDRRLCSLRIHSIVGITSLFAVSIIEKKKLDKLVDFKKRISWFEHYRLTHKKFWPNEEKLTEKPSCFRSFPATGL